ncbi:hypothetical protein GY45DRAFT_1376393 [Cubamyces sp. BRFM 1775]|nr:hypothetical protein GY45DRAFT_1376393 [Cubamyces sp. BRFM 1775]
MDSTRFSPPASVIMRRASSQLSGLDNTNRGTDIDSDSDIQLIDRSEVDHNAFPRRGTPLFRELSHASLVGRSGERIRPGLRPGRAVLARFSPRSTPGVDIGPPLRAASPSSDAGSESGSVDVFVRRLFNPERPYAQFQPFAPSGVTSSRFLQEVLSLRVSMVAPLRSAGYDHPDLVITERDLRALLMKALLWMIDRECVVDVDGSRIVFVGREPGEPGQPLYPSIALDELRMIAAELPEEMQSPSAVDDFDAFLFHADRYFTDGWAPLAVAVVNGAVFTALTSILFFCFIRVMELIM